ncbi:hypothetical protein Indivirus_5_39 [Indivirus ILV1]|uniref:Uncharacterized protein n=1 Tax=Indivirus ILV1 TaxID=1977633 RepID=A0A1V0SDY5_9VIRU|nr:hypothetical protein Indivirus_5_39 [Indivirus ILV1]
MDLETVRLCFKKFITYLETNEKISISETVDFESISIIEMDRLTQTIFMDYVMNNAQKISPTAIPCVLYKHVNSLIRKYIEEDHSKPMVKVINIGNEKQIDPKNEEPKKKGWIW